MCCCSARCANKLKAGTSPWPPFRSPAECGEAYEDPRHILRSRVFHAAALVVLYKAVRGHVNEHVMALVVFLLEQAVIVSDQKDDKDKKMCPSGPQPPRMLTDMDLTNWFVGDCLFDNLRTEISRVFLSQEPEVSPITYSSDSDPDWDSTEADAEIAEMAHIMLNEPAVGWQVDMVQDSSGISDVMLYRPPADSPRPYPALPSSSTSTSSVSTPMEVDRVTTVATDADIESPTAGTLIMLFLVFRYYSNFF